MELHGVGITGEVEQFSKPLFQTLGALRVLRRFGNNAGGCVRFIDYWVHS